MLRYLALRAWSSLLLTGFLASTSFALTLPPDFVVESGANTGFNNPVALAFAPDGRILVAEKRGVVRVVVNGIKLPAPMWDEQDEVLNQGDRGLLGIAVDPDYATNRYVYLLYTVDPDSNDVDDDAAAFSRLTRYRTRADNPNLIDPSSRTVLIGVSWADGIPSGSSSHGPGALRWGADRSLLVSSGDGAHYAAADAGGHDPALFAPGRLPASEDIGAFRTQSVASLSGKVLRVNPADGAGYASNPYYDGDLRSNRSRVWAYGFRNPFRFCLRPGTGSTDPAAGDPGVTVIADVGWSNWEELNVATRGGMNFGWPCHEGPVPQGMYQAVQSGPWTCATTGPDNPVAPTAPTLALHHADSSLSVPEGLESNCIVAGVFYTGNSYPAPYRNRLFIADFGKNWIKVATLDGEQRLVEVIDFADGTQGPVDFAADPLSGDIYYVAIYTGQLNRIRYTGSDDGNAAPVALAAGSPAGGFGPLQAAFSSVGSGDPDYDPISYAWSFGDGEGSTLPAPIHTYAARGTYQAVLTVSDGRGGIGRDTVEVQVWEEPGFPATTVIDGFERADGPLGAPWIGSISGLAVDDQALVQSSASSYAIWDGAQFGPDQEAHVTFGASTPGAEHNLLLKVQGRSWQDGHVQVHYHTAVGGVIVLTYTRAAGWVRVGGPFPHTFGAGDRLGARAYASGRIEAYKNGTLIGTAWCGDWPHAAKGGRVGLILAGAGATRIEDFGAGDIVPHFNARPTALALAPADPTFFVAGDTVRLSGAGIDPEDAAESLASKWEVDIMHNNHVHPASLIFDGTSGTFVAENHDDGTGVWMRARFMTTDRSGASDTTTVRLLPEIDLEPSDVVTAPETPGTVTPARYRFTIRNHGRMPSSLARWRLVAGGITLAQGDTLVPPAGEVTVEREVAPLLPPGVHDLEVVVDALDAIHETVEENNARTRELMVWAEGTLDVAELPLALGLSGAHPNPAIESIGFALALPQAERVELAIFDVQGRQVWTAAPRTYTAGRWTLRWGGEQPGGHRVKPGIYMARIKVGGETFSRRIVMIGG